MEFPKLAGNCGACSHPFATNAKGWGTQFIVEAEPEAL